MTDWNPDDPDATRVYYDLSAWSIDQQGELAAEMAEAEIPHAWDGTELVVPEEFEQAADVLIGDVEIRLGIESDQELAGGVDEASPLERIALEPDVPTTEFGLDEWSAGDRSLVDRALVGASIPFRWEGATLLVATTDEDVVDAILDSVEAGETDDLVELAEETDQLPFETLTTFFLAGERLRRNPFDADGLEQLIAATSVADLTQPPYGVEQRLWERTCALAEQLADVLADEVDVDADAAMAVAEQLHDLLRPYV
jgi:hypothetical protein